MSVSAGGPCWYTCHGPQPSVSQYLFMEARRSGTAVATVDTVSGPPGRPSRADGSGLTTRGTRARPGSSRDARRGPSRLALLHAPQLLEARLVVDRVPGGEVAVRGTGRARRRLLA